MNNRCVCRRSVLLRVSVLGYRCVSALRCLCYCRLALCAFWHRYIIHIRAAVLLTQKLCHTASAAGHIVLHTVLCRKAGSSLTVFRTLLRTVWRLQFSSGTRTAIWFVHISCNHSPHLLILPDWVLFIYAFSFTSLFLSIKAYICFFATLYRFFHLSYSSVFFISFFSKE